MRNKVLPFQKKRRSQNECVEPPLSPKLVGSAISSNFAQGGAILDTNDSHKNNMPTNECRIHQKHRTFIGFIAWAACLIVQTLPLHVTAEANDKTLQSTHIMMIGGD